MRIQRSWVLCVLTITVLLIAGHKARAQSYPYPGAAPATAGYPGMPPMQAEMPGPPANAPQYAPQYTPQYAPDYVAAMQAAQSGYAPMGMPQYPPQGLMMPPQGMPPQGAMMPPQGAMMPPQGAMMPPQGAMMPPGGGYGYQPAAYYDPAQGAIPQQLSPSPAMPMGDAGGYPPGGYPMEGQPCQYCGGYGCEVCMGGSDDFDVKLFRWLLPYGAGGCGAQRWYDASAEWVSLQRDDIGESTIFATEGPGGIPVLCTDQLNFSDTSGFRASFAVQLNAGNLLETTYLGSFNWASQAEATNDDNDLFSIMSDYGNSPLFGFTDTDQASVQRIEYSSSFDTIDLNYRQRWVGPNTRIQGSWLVGARYMYMTEDFNYLTFAPIQPGWMNYLVSTSNSLTGAQVGGDLWVCIMPGLSMGGEIKAGLFGNRSTQRTTIDAYSIGDPVQEKLTEKGAAFLGDANVTLIWRLSQHWTLRSGYMFLWMDQIALASDNFNPQPPFVAGVRHPVINNNSDAFYHGFTAGLEYMW